jgi:hypothetical protein
MTLNHVLLALVVGSVCTLTGSALAGQEGDRSSSKRPDHQSYNKVSFETRDQTGAVIPLAHIVILDQLNGAITEKDGDISGRVEFVLPQGGQYKVTVTAKGFKQFAESFEMQSDIVKAVVLKVLSYSGPVVVEEVAIPVQHSNIANALPTHPLKLLPLPAKQILKARHP